jgi:hypothetical protein
MMNGPMKFDHTVSTPSRSSQRALRVDDDGQRLVPDPHRLGRVLGQVSVPRDDDGDGLAHEPRAVGRRAVVVHGRGHAHRERLRRPGDVLAGDHPDDARHGERLGHLVAQDAGVGVGRADDRGVADVGDGGMVVEEGPSSPQEPRILDALDRFPDPAPLRSGCPWQSAPILATAPRGVKVGAARSRRRSAAESLDEVV